ncbi:8-oxoguanine DNA-glycosylase (ogg) [Coccidioides immitis RS]|uniref:N-glycosylase/DNA lyase n=4 Tax=Coccidioides immitis TaxID=5501 RepID=A0A0E1S3F9_COCIM|nr:8-oxoguanine DNA-glycosylase (ogg) [Coccidioides immitis RS]KMP04835.1 N-glycosylase/DNA lyase [Coccidioides immitis RMSCC 2394]KMU78399.1 N-glycosylase/DNA lyase [Coccidioides immitis RMSCC 3703]KMU86332.1 N-glycosylase/DNA lyase [Coccidioides immitis H538.4]TPX21316.1 8-oxoguanine glycosylase ogg1 [Coccidioides immitis]EAS33649.1 8-oxoguanine DNA-glycosylase (ogg) [Coccidioides immitis RS]
MSIGHFSEWRKLPVSLTELCINTTLRCGQTFRWRKSAEDEWSCVLHGRIVSLRQDADHLHYRSLFPRARGDLATAQKTNDDTEALIRHYFNLEPNLSGLYEQWAEADKNFKKKALQFTGIRILRQDAWEALVSFICSSNNNIARISQMVEKLCTNYGPLIGHIDKQPYHGFPPPSALIGQGVEARLRELGFGYRAKYIYKTAVMVANEREKGWLNSLRNPERPAFGEKPNLACKMEAQGKTGYREAHENLLELQGVGPKVADCVCLMGLGWGEAVPVDTHVWQIAQRDYKFGKGKQKSLTKATYDAVGDHFRKLWGKEAGWAHSVLFTADLKVFSDRLTETAQTDKAMRSLSNGNIKEEIKLKTETRVSVKRELTDDSISQPISTAEIVAKERATKRRKTRRG